MYCIARSIALGVRDLLLLPEEDVSAEDLELLFLRVRPVENLPRSRQAGAGVGHDGAVENYCSQVGRHYISLVSKGSKRALLQFITVLYMYGK